MMTGADYLSNLAKIRELLSLSADLFERAKVAVGADAVHHKSWAAWLKEPRQRLLLSVVTLLLLTSLAKLIIFLWGDNLIESEVFKNFIGSKGAIYVLEACLVILIVMYIVGKGRREEESVDNAALARGFRAENQFFAYWPYLWLSWFLLYLLLAYHELRPIDEAYLSVLANFANNLTSMFIFGMFFELTEKTADRSKAGSRHAWLPMFMILLLLSVAEGLSYAIAPPPSHVHIQYAFGLFSGLLVGVLTGLFVSRLTSRIFDLPYGTLVVLTFYAVLQPIFPILTASTIPYGEEIGYAAALIALYAKIILLLTIEWMRDNYRVLYFMIKAARIWEEERERHLSDTFGNMLAGILDGKSREDVDRPSHLKVVSGSVKGLSSGAGSKTD